MKNILLSLVFGVIGAILFNVLTNYLYERPIAVVRLDEVIADHLTVYAEKDLSSEEQASVGERFASVLDQVIASVSDEQRVTLLVDPAVVSNVPDYTDYIKGEIERLMDED